MKEIYLITIFMACVQLMAQPTINQAQFPISTGDILVVYTDAYIAPSEGTNQTWNYSAFNISSPSGINIIDPSSSSIAGLPASTICYNESGSEDCFLINASGMQRTGIGGPLEDFPYQDAEYIFQFPITYGSSSTDTYYSSFVTNGFNGTRHGNVDIDVVGYGTLQLPDDTVINTMMIRMHEVGTDSIDVFGMWDVFLHDYTNYYFYAAGHHGSILSLINGSTTMVGDTTFYPSAAKYYRLTYAEGIESLDLSSNFKIFPNPVGDQLQITSTTNMDFGRIEYSVINMQGQVIKTGILNQENLSLNVSELNSGLYILQIEHQLFYASKRFIKN